MGFPGESTHGAAWGMASRGRDLSSNSIRMGRASARRNYWVSGLPGRCPGSPPLKAHAPSCPPSPPTPVSSSHKMSHSRSAQSYPLSSPLSTFLHRRLKLATRAAITRSIRCAATERTPARILPSRRKFPSSLPKFLDLRVALFPRCPSGSVEHLIAVVQRHAFPPLAKIETGGDHDDVTVSGCGQRHRIPLVAQMAFMPKFLFCRRGNRFFSRKQSALHVVKRTANTASTCCKGSAETV
jgi:hypothetical protein